jgi:hypothetical protein
MLWSYDEPRARKLFEEAFQAMTNATARERSLWVSPIGPDSHYSVRNVVIPAIIRRDPALAVRLAENIAELSGKSDPKSDQYTERSLILSHLVSLMSSMEPRLSSQLGKIFAERGDIQNLGTLLSQIRRTEPKAADDLFVLALEKARLGKPSIDDIRSFGSYLFPFFGEGVIRHSSGAAKRDPLQAATRNPLAVSQFLELAYEAAK